VTRLLPLILAAALSVLVAAPAAQATHPQPPLDITKMDYSPIGHFKPGEAVPTNAGTACDQLLKPLMNGKKFNPSGKFNAYDNNVFEVLCLPYRQYDDQSNTDP
jgi:hypothetical protein